MHVSLESLFNSVAIGMKPFSTYSFTSHSSYTGSMSVDALCLSRLTGNTVDRVGQAMDFGNDEELEKMSILRISCGLRGSH